MILSCKLTAHDLFILDPHPYKIGPNWNTTKWTVVKGLYRLDQKNEFFYFGSLEARISHNKIVWAHFNIFHISTIYRLDQKNEFFYFGSLEARISHNKIVWAHFNIFHISTISLSLLMASGWGCRNPSSSLLLITLPFSFTSLYFSELGIIWCRNELCM